MPKLLPKCKEGYELLRDSCRCKKKKKPKTKPKTKKKPKPKTKKKKKTKKALKINNSTPSVNREMRDMVLSKLKTRGGIVKSYSPTINRELEVMKSHSPQRDMFIPCGGKKLKTKSGKCVGWSSQEARAAMLHNLTSKKEINMNVVVAPKQLRSNCWFNVFFMVFFISDKGRSFFRHLRQMMITGVKSVNNEQIKKGLRWPFFQLNRAIDASLRGNVFAQEMDTNKIISSISRQIKTTTKVGKAGNPLDFYLSIIKYLNNEPFRFEYNSKYYRNSAVSKKQPPHLIIYEYDDEDSKKRKAKLQFRHKSGHTYRLENVILRDTSESHFACFLTCNRKEWAFDGFSYSRMMKWKWKQMLNKNKDFSFQDYSISDVMEFNFKQGYQILFYYRID